MAQSTQALIDALRETARRLWDGAPYAWARMGSCNCGHLAQTVTGFSRLDVQRRALQQAGDWSEQVQGYCHGSGLPMEDIFDAMLRIGVTREDLIHLERLSDPEILAAIPGSYRPLNHKLREDVVLYMETWADLLEAGRQRKLHPVRVARSGEMASLRC